MDVREKSNVFITYMDQQSKVEGFNRESAVLEIALYNLEAIAKNAISTTFIFSDNLCKVIDFDLNLRDLKFIPPNENPLYYYTPQFVVDIFGGAMRTQEDTQYEDFFGFIASCLPDLVKNQPFPFYFVDNAQSFSMGLKYLERFYRFKKLDRKEKSVQKAIETVEILRACFQLIGNKEPTFLSGIYDKSFKIIEVENSPQALKEMMVKIKSIYYSYFYLFPWDRFKISALLKEILGPEASQKFLSICLQLKDTELNKLIDVLHTISEIDSLSLKTDMLILHLFQNPSFYLLQNLLLEKIFKEKYILESEEDFNKRCEREIAPVVKIAIQHIQYKISVIKNDPHAKELLKAYATKIFELKGISYYQPFQNISNFLFHHYHTPKIENYCGLPMPIGHSDLNQFIANVFLLAPKLEDANLHTAKGREILLKSCEFMFLKNAKIDQEKLQAWYSFFTEQDFAKHPQLHAFIKEILGSH